MVFGRTAPYPHSEPVYTTTAYHSTIPQPFTTDLIRTALTRTDCITRAAQQNHSCDLCLCVCVCVIDSKALKSQHSQFEDNRVTCARRHLRLSIFRWSMTCNDNDGRCCVRDHCAPVRVGCTSWVPTRHEAQLQHGLGWQHAQWPDVQ